MFVDFVSYAFLYHQKQMLTDRVRMNAYHDAITLNEDMFRGKVVLDVGAGRYDFLALFICCLVLSYFPFPSSSCLCLYSFVICCAS